MASEQTFSDWYFAYCQANNRTPSMEEVWNGRAAPSAPDSVAPSSLSADAIDTAHEWIEEALSYVGSEAWSPSLHREGATVLQLLQRAGAGWTEDQMEGVLQREYCNEQAISAAPSALSPFGYAVKDRRGMWHFYESLPYLDNALDCLPVYTQAQMLALTPPAQAPAIQAPEAVAVVNGSDMVIGRESRSLAFAEGVNAFSIPPGTKLFATPSPAVSAAVPVPDELRLDFMLEKSAFIVWSNRDGSIRQCQLMSQDEDEVYTVLSGMDRYFNIDRQAIDAAIALATPAPAPTQPQPGTGGGKS